jgi:hypothetical protein
MYFQDCLRRAKEQLCRDVVADPDADPASLVYEEVHDPAYAGLRVTWADLVAACQPLKEPLVQVGGWVGGWVWGVLAAVRR